MEISGDRVAGLLHTTNDEIGDRTIATTGSINLVYGEDKIQEQLLDLKFEISMKSFFQTNPKCDGESEIFFSCVLQHSVCKSACQH